MPEDCMHAHRARIPQHLEAPALMVLSALPHLPFSIRLHCTIGVSEQVRDFWRTLDVFFIFTCAGMWLSLCTALDGLCA